MRKASSIKLSAQYRKAPAAEFSSNDLEKELLALDAKVSLMRVLAQRYLLFDTVLIQNIPAAGKTKATTTDYSYETESDDEEVTDESEDDVDVFQLPKVYDSKDVDVCTLTYPPIISLSCYSCTLPFPSLLSLFFYA